MEYNQIAQLQAQLHDSKRLFDSALHRLIGRWGLTENMFRILYVLSANPDGIEPARIAEQTNLLRPAVSPVLNKLLRQKLITREERNGDHRRIRIVLTEKGIGFVKKVKAECLEIESRAFAPFSPEEVQNMVALFTRYTRCFLEVVKTSEKADQ